MPTVVGGRFPMSLLALRHRGCGGFRVNLALTWGGIHSSPRLRRPRSVLQSEQPVEPAVGTPLLAFDGLSR